MSDIELIEEGLFPEEATHEGFVIDNLDRAEWALSKIGAAKDRIEKREEIAERLIQRIKARLAEITKADREGVEYLSAMLRPWADKEIATNGKARSVKLLGGDVGFRQAPARLEITDEAMAIAWLETNAAEGIRVKKEINKREVMDIINLHGEIPPGIELIPGEVNFYVRPHPLVIEKKESK